MDATLSKYLTGLTHLKRGSTPRGLAPNKPVLLITLIELIEIGAIYSEIVKLNSVLASTFQENWELLVDTPYDPDFTQPLYHLQNDRVDGIPVWELVPQAGIKIDKPLGSVKALKSKVAFGRISKEFFVLLSNKANLQMLKETLLDYYFKGKKEQILNQRKTEYNLQKLELFALNEPEIKYKKVSTVIEEFDQFIRNGKFKKYIPLVYSSTCSFTGLKVNSELGHKLVEACHIIPFSDRQDDSIQNGIALSPNMHKVFDQGLITVDENYRLKVSEKVIENKDHVYSLAKLHNQQIILPSNPAMYPAQEKLAWHRQNRFKK